MAYDKEKAHEYYLKNKDRILKQAKQWAVENPDRIKEFNKKYKSSDNPTYREYCENNYELWILNSAKRNAERYDLPSLKAFLNWDTIWSPRTMTKELEQLQYNDTMTDLAASMEAKGARRFLMDFRDNYPSHFKEIQDQIHRLDQRPVCKLLQPDDADPV